MPPLRSRERSEVRLSKSVNTQSESSPRATQSHFSHVLHLLVNGQDMLFVRKNQTAFWCLFISESRPNPPPDELALTPIIHHSHETLLEVSVQVSFNKSESMSRQRAEDSSKTPANDNLFATY